MKSRSLLAGRTVVACMKYSIQKGSLKYILSKIHHSVQIFFVSRSYLIGLNIKDKEGADMLFTGLDKQNC